MKRSLKRRKLRCSFCGKSEHDVERLVGGPGVAICDACVGLCNTILQATPAPFAGWEAMSDDQILQSIKPVEAAAASMRTVLQTQVDVLRKRGVSWALIGAALGISRQAAWERFT